MKDSIKNYINVENVQNACKEYGKIGPFNHVVIDNFFLPNVAEKLENEFPGFEDKCWYSYNNAIEVKKGCNNWHYFPPMTYQVFSLLNSSNFMNSLTSFLSLESKLFADPGLNGGGWHIHRQGGKLNTHLDYSLHEKLELQRKLNIIVYLNPNWQENWGGSLGLWGNESAIEPGKLEKSIWSKFNRAVIFDTTQNSWHGLPDPLTCPDTEYRKSIAVYYLVHPAPKIEKRYKALFAPTSDQANDSEVLELIKKRSMLNEARNVWKK